MSSDKDTKKILVGGAIALAILAVLGSGFGLGKGKGRGTGNGGSKPRPGTEPGPKPGPKPGTLVLWAAGPTIRRLDTHGSIVYGLSGTTIMWYDDPAAVLKDVKLVELHPAAGVQEVVKAFIDDIKERGIELAEVDT